MHARFTTNPVPTYRVGTVRETLHYPTASYTYYKTVKLLRVPFIEMTWEVLPWRRKSDG